MEIFTRTVNYSPCITDGQVLDTTFKGTGTIITKNLAAKGSMFATDCDWNIKMIAEIIPSILINIVK
jgi:hypothetical protein